MLVRANDLLVPAIDTDDILRFSKGGAFLGVFAAAGAFTEQLHETATETILAAEFTNDFINEYTATGTLLASYTFPGLAGFRGVYELPSTALLVTTGNGVFEVLRTGTVVRQIVSGVSARFIERIPDVFIVADEDAPATETALRVAGANPFSSETTLQLTVSQAQAVRVAAYDVTGRLVATLFDGTLAAGTAQMLTLRGAALAPGVYVVRATGETFTSTRQVSHTR